MPQPKVAAAALLNRQPDATPDATAVSLGPGKDAQEPHPLARLEREADEARSQGLLRLAGALYGQCIDELQPEEGTRRAREDDESFLARVRVKLAKVLLKQGSHHEAPNPSPNPDPEPYPNLKFPNPDPNFPNAN